jgi:hypothetical protein
MKAEDWFGVALRFVGLIALLYGVRDLIDHLLYRLGYFSFPETSPRYYVVMGLVQIFAGLYLLRGAPLLVRFAFPGARDDEDDEIDDEDDAADDAPPPVAEADERARPDAR